LFRLREELARTPLVPSMREAVRNSGMAIVFVSSAVSIGYLVLLFSPFAAWRHLGALTALIMTVSAAATLTVVPAFLIILKPRFLLSGESTSENIGAGTAGSARSARFA